MSKVWEKTNGQTLLDVIAVWFESNISIVHWFLVHISHCQFHSKIFKVKSSKSALFFASPVPLAFDFALVFSWPKTTEKCILSLSTNSGIRPSIHPPVCTMYFGSAFRCNEILWPSRAVKHFSNTGERKGPPTDFGISVLFFRKTVS